MNNQQSPNYFELLGLPEQFDLDVQELQTRWKARAAQVHPDRFAAASAAEKRIAMQWSAELNEAYRTLKDPIPRARYLCELNGTSLSDQQGQHLDVAFLEQQMVWRETLESLQETSLDHDKLAPQLKALSTQVEHARQQCLQTVAHKLEARCWPQAATALKQLMFIEKFTQEVARVSSARS